MRRLVCLLATVTALLAMAFAGSALATSNGGGNSANAPGQVKAAANCSAAYHNQDGSGVQAGGGPKSAETGPLNCDHYWQSNGAIGNTP